MQGNISQLEATILRDEQTALNFARQCGIIRSSLRCESCRRDCLLVADRTKIDGCFWRCSQCLQKKSIRHGSWFSGSHLSMNIMLRLLYYWTQDVDQDFAKHECGIGSQHTIVDYYHFCRQTCYEVLESNNEMLGGPGVEVEIDEAKMGRRKFHRGRRVDGVWLFGAVERGCNWSRCCIIPVERRDEETLLGEIRKFIAPDTVIYSDCWKAYTGLATAGYTHRTVNHSEAFVDPISGAHTNNIEGLWNQVRRFMPRFGTTKDMYAGYMIEFMYCRKYFSGCSRSERFSIFITHLKDLGFIWGRK
jgi:hypothetical protein